MKSVKDLPLNTVSISILNQSNIAVISNYDPSTWHETVRP